MVQTLIDFGANVNARTAGYEYRDVRTPLDMAADVAESDFRDRKRKAHEIHTYLCSVGAEMASKLEEKNTMTTPSFNKI